MLVLVGTVAEMTGLGAEEDLFSFFDMLLDCLQECLVWSIW
jgi:hypothetical protein